MEASIHTPVITKLRRGRAYLDDVSDRARCRDVLGADILARRLLAPVQCSSIIIISSSGRRRSNDFGAQQRTRGAERCAQRACGCWLGSYTQRGALC
jgi:hypothetical protein